MSESSILLLQRLYSKNKFWKIYDHDVVCVMMCVICNERIFSEELFQTMNIATSDQHEAVVYYEPISMILMILTTFVILIAKKIQGIQQGHKMSHNVGTRLLSGFLVSFACGVVEWNCWMIVLTAIQTGCLGALYRSQSLTALNR